jgi:hypothetical protein
VGAIALSYLLVPFQAYAALKGLFEKEEGPWFRTPKTGKITDPITHLRRLKKLRKWLFGNGHGSGGTRRPVPAHITTRPPRRPSRRLGWIVTIAIVCALGGLGVDAVNAPVAEAAGTTLYLHGGTCPTTNGTMNTTSPTSTVNTWTIGTVNQTCTWATTTATSAAQTIFNTPNSLALLIYAESTHNGTQSAAFSATFGYSSSSTCSSVTTIATQASFSFSVSNQNTWNQELPPFFTQASNVTVPAGSFFCLTITITTANSNIKFGWDASAENSNLQSSQTIFIPEYGLLFVAFAFLLPLSVRQLRRRLH